MEQARASLEARKAQHLGPLPPKCRVCGKISSGEVYVGARPMGAVCDPLLCGITLVGEAYFSIASFAKWPPGRYRGA